jgi:pyruvate/2-oxoglutarate dehydrogenase complex dihydrolipoamide acyltransferase (E2) component
MKKVFKLPDVGEGIAEAEIVEYLVAVGDKVRADQNVVRVETDKAVVELPCPFTGTVAEIPHKTGDAVRVGEALLVIETDAKEESEAAAEPEGAADRKKSQPEEEPEPSAEREESPSSDTRESGGRAENLPLPTLGNLAAGPRGW